MLIDVHDAWLNWTLNTCFFLILGLGAASLVPWRLRSGANRWTLMLPVLALLVYLMYELAMPSNWDIRMDLLVLWPVLALIVLLGVLRGVLIWRHNSRISRGQRH